MTNTTKIQCNLGHWHEVDLPDDLISLAEAARLAQRTIQAIANHIDQGHIIAYPTKTRFGSTKRMVSKSQITTLYPTTQPYSA